MFRKLLTIAMMLSLTALSGFSATTLLTDDFESYTVGFQPTNGPADIVRPAPGDGGNTSILFVKTVGGTTNSAGTGQGVEILDNDLTPSIGAAALEYNFASASNAQYSLIQINFSFAYKTNGSTMSGTNYISIGVGDYNTDSTMGANANRFNDTLRLYDTGTISFSGSGGTDITPVDTLHTVAMYMNDLPDDTHYVGPDSTTNKLKADSVTYWLDGVKAATVSLEVGETNQFGELIGASTNNFGKFGINTPSTREGNNYVFDDLTVATLDTFFVPEPVLPPNILYIDFEDDIVGQPPTASTTAALIRPNLNSAECFNQVVGAGQNTAGEGNGMWLRDNLPTSGVGGLDVTSFEVNFGTNVLHAISAVRVDLKFAYVTTDPTTNGVVKPIHFGLGQYDDVRSFFTSSRRFTDVRFYPDGTVDFRRNQPPGATGLPSSVMTNYPDTSDVPALPGQNTLTMFANDYDTQAVEYTGLDGEQYMLPTNSVAYWLNGELILHSTTNGNSVYPNGTTNEWTILDWYDRQLNTPPFPDPYVVASEGNFQKIGFNSETSATNLSWIFDEILVSTQLIFVVTSYEQWLSLYPAIGVNTNYTDDPELDGLDNLSEYALGGNPTTNDAALFEPSYHLSGGGSFLNMVYNRRDNADDLGLTYDALGGLSVTVPLTSPVAELGFGDGELGFEVVTNQIPTSVGSEAFMKLDITID